LTRQGRSWLDSEKEPPQSVSISLEEEGEGEEDDAVLDDAYENIEVSILKFMLWKTGNQRAVVRVFIIYILTPTNTAKDRLIQTGY
jgi:hypothetical protein